jgi:hypothetical protein
VPIVILIFCPDAVSPIRDFSSDIVADRGKTDAPVSASSDVVHRITQIVPTGETKEESLFGTPGR